MRMNLGLLIDSPSFVPGVVALIGLVVWLVRIEGKVSEIKAHGSDALAVLRDHLAYEIKEIKDETSAEFREIRESVSEIGSSSLRNADTLERMESELREIKDFVTTTGLSMLKEDFNSKLDRLKEDLLRDLIIKLKE